MFDGTIRTLTDVRYIPKMKRNLISVSALDAKGYKYSGGNSVLKVTKGSLVVMKGDLSSNNGLYYLQVLPFQVTLLQLFQRILIVMLLTFGTCILDT